jgi:nicotinamide-nucleotide amidase
MHVELINTGSELLLGQVVNTHLKFLAETLWKLGISIQRQTTVPDGEIIRDALAESFTRADVVIVTGGLGPTTDDITRDITAELLGLTLQVDPEIAGSIENRLKTRNIPVSERILRQAERPAESEVLPNQHGTAPGLYIPPVALENRGRSPHLFLLPGPPRELQPMVMSAVVPRLQALLPEGGTELMQTWRIIGVPESVVEEAVGQDLLSLGIKLGYCARPGEVDVRIIGSQCQLTAAETLIKTNFPNAVLPEDFRTLEDWIVAELTRRNKTLATAESCTGGALANQITNAPGSSAVFGYGFITYANAAKQDLGVDEDLIKRHGAVSQPVAEALAEKALRRANADYALATTGIAGPAGGSEDKPVGTVYIALAQRDGSTAVEKRLFTTDRHTFKHLVVQHALSMLRRSMLEIS